MRRHFRLQQGYCLLTAGLAKIAQGQPRPLASLHGRTALQIGKREVARPVTAVCSSQKGKQGGVLADGHKLAITLGPTLGGKTRSKNSDFSKKWI
jgi:hypothetical protein